MNRFLVFRKTIVVILLLSLTVGLFTFLSFASDTQILSESFEGAVEDCEKDNQDSSIGSPAYSQTGSETIDFVDNFGISTSWDSERENEAELNELVDLTDPKELESVIKKSPYYYSLSESQKNEHSLLRTLPSAVDNSTDPAFPQVVSQGNVSSCVPFSIVYYQFSYHMNKKNNISSSNINDCFSPDWAYYSIVNPEYDPNNPDDLALYSNPTDCYNFTKEHGAVKWNELTPQSNFNPNYSLPSNNAMLSALSTRIESVQSAMIHSNDGNGNKVEVLGSNELNAIKELLSDGFILRVSSYFEFNTKVSNGIYYIYRFFKPTSVQDDYGNHSYCVVGYDDNVGVDVNGNNTIEANERGAFKVVNSNGTNWHNGGFSWILYDALNIQSSISGNWESGKPGQRLPAFTTSYNGQNRFEFISVDNYKNFFVVQSDYTSVPRNLESYYGTIINDTTTISRNAGMRVKNTDIRSFSSFLTYGVSTSYVDSIITGSDFRVSRHMDVPANKFSAKLVDNCGNELCDMISGPYTLYLTGSISFIKGDVNYSESLNSVDVTRIQQYIIGSRVFSDLQIYLADFNNDGKVNAKDVTALMNAIIS